jgi:AcrR family transcriptional regulator
VAEKNGQSVGAERGSDEREPLSRELLVRTALRIVDEEGLDALSMRRLGSELGVNPMAAYHHFPNKAALLDGVVEAVMAEIDLGVDDPDLPAEERLVTAAKEYARVLFAHKNTLPVVLGRGPSTPASMAPVELMVRILRDGGLSLEHAVAGMNTVAAAVRGYVAMFAPALGHAEEAPDMETLAAMVTAEDFPNLHEAMSRPQSDSGEQFEFGLRCLAIGLLGSE